MQRSRIDDWRHSAREMAARGKSAAIQTSADLKGRLKGNFGTATTAVAELEKQQRPKRMANGPPQQAASHDRQ